jgi:hypothetical protein
MVGWVFRVGVECAGNWFEYVVSEEWGEGRGIHEADSSESACFSCMCCKYEFLGCWGCGVL